MTLVPTTQRADEDLEKPSLVVGLSVFISVLALLFYGAYVTQQWLQDEQQLPVQKVVFSGDYIVLQNDHLEALIRQQQRGSFFALDVNQVHALLEEQPWVYRASVRKRWPNSLHVYIVEQNAVAKWNDDAILNQYGDTFDGFDAAKSMNIPSLFGPNGSEKTALAGLQTMKALLKVTQVQVKHLFLSERFAWRVELNNGIQLNLGRQEFIDRLQRFIDVFPLLMKQNKEINYVDLRYDTGLAVGWGQNSSNTGSKQ